MTTIQDQRPPRIRRWCLWRSRRYNGRLRDLITTGQARPSRIVSHRLALEEAPDAFRRFDERRDGYLKVILSPNDE